MLESLLQCGMNAATVATWAATKRDVFLMEAIRRGRTYQSYDLYLVSTRFFQRMQHITFYVTMTFTILPFSPSFTIIFSLWPCKMFAFAIRSFFNSFATFFVARQNIQETKTMSLVSYGLLRSSTNNKKKRMKKQQQQHQRHTHDRYEIFKSLCISSHRKLFASVFAMLYSWLRCVPFELV